MITNFAAREVAKEALLKQREALAEHRERLASFREAYAQLDTSTEEVVGDVLHEAILREQRRVAIIETNILDIQRDLRTKYSVTPENLAL